MKPHELLPCAHAGCYEHLSAPSAVVLARRTMGRMKAGLVIVLGAVLTISPLLASPEGYHWFFACGPLAVVAAVLFTQCLVAGFVVPILWHVAHRPELPLRSKRAMVVVTLVLFAVSFSGTLILRGRPLGVCG